MLPCCVPLQYARRLIQKLSKGGAFRGGLRKPSCGHPRVPTITLYEPAADQQPATGWSTSAGEKLEQPRSGVRPVISSKFSAVHYHLKLTLVGLAHRTASIMPHALSLLSHYVYITVSRELLRSDPVSCQDSLDSSARRSCTARRDELATSAVP